MKITYSFELCLNIDQATVVSNKPFVAAAIESVDEFVGELHAFIERQPLVEGCSVNKIEE